MCFPIPMPIPCQRQLPWSVTWCLILRLIDTLYTKAHESQIVLCWTKTQTRNAATSICISKIIITHHTGAFDTIICALPLQLLQLVLQIFCNFDASLKRFYCTYDISVRFFQEILCNRFSCIVYIFPHLLHCHHDAKETLVKSPMGNICINFHLLSHYIYLSNRLAKHSWSVTTWILTEYYSCWWRRNNEIPTLRHITNTFYIRINFWHCRFPDTFPPSLHV